MQGLHARPAQSTWTRCRAAHVLVGLGDGAGLGDRVGQRFLAVDVLAVPDGGPRGHGVNVGGSGDHYRAEIPLLVEQRFLSVRW
jgi:hypothetical protein